MSHNDIEEILALEARRVTASAAGDAAAMAEVYADDHVHVHGNGQVDDKATLVAQVSGLKRSTDPRTPNIRVFGDVAVLTGPLTLRLDRGQGPEVIRMFATQVARRDDGRWRFVSMQVTRITV